VGNEANCVARFGKQKARGRAQLETSELIFRSEDGAMRMKFTFADIKSAAAADGQLRVEVPEGTAIFELGANAAKWCEKFFTQDAAGKIRHQAKCGGFFGWQLCC